MVQNIAQIPRSSGVRDLRTVAQNQNGPPTHAQSITICRTLFNESPKQQNNKLLRTYHITYRFRHTKRFNLDNYWCKFTLQLWSRWLLPPPPQKKKSHAGYFEPQLVLCEAWNAKRSISRNKRDIWTPMSRTILPIHSKLLNIHHRMSDWWSVRELSRPSKP